jgi:basic amino acid/polyamine antiporter, APA family
VSEATAAPPTVRTTELRRALGFRTVVSTSTGLAFAAIEYLAIAGLITYVAGDSGWIAIAVAGVLLVAVWGFYGELNGLYPTAAAIRLFMKHSMDDRWALSITFTYMLTIVLVIAADAFIVGSAISHVLGAGGVVTALCIVALLAVATAANLRGIRVAGNLQDIATYSVIVVTIGMAFAGVVKGGPLHTPFQPLRGHGAGSFLQAVALGVFLYSAFEWVTASSEEVRSPELIPRGMLASLWILFVTCSLAAMAMSHLLTRAQLDSAFPQLFLGSHVAGRFGEGLMLAVTMMTAINTFNGGFVTASRFMYATAREGNLPPVFASLNESAVPWFPVVALAVSSLVLALIVAVTSSWQVLVSAGAALEAMIYAVAGFCVYRLRDRQPDAERPFRMMWAKPLAVGGMVLFAILAVAAGVSVNDRTNPLPLVIILACGGLAVAYVLLWLPKIRAAEAARLAARPARRPRRPQNAG